MGTEKWKRRTLLWVATTLAIAAGLSAAFLFHIHRARRQRITIGAVEQVVLLPWNIILPARVDTGAATSSLDARDIQELPGRKEIQFRLPERCGGLLVRRRLRGWRTVTSSDGTSERRPVVTVELQLGSHRFNTQVTLTDRSRMKYPMLLGRNTLGNHYIVDVTQTNLLSAELTESDLP